MGPKPVKSEQRAWSMCLISTTILLCLHSSWSFFHRVTSSSCTDANVRHRLQRRSMRGVCRYRTRGTVIMERATGKFQRLAKPKFDPQNPNAVLGEVKVPGLEQVRALPRSEETRVAVSDVSPYRTQHWTVLYLFLLEYYCTIVRFCVACPNSPK